MKNISNIASSSSSGVEIIPITENKTQAAPSTLETRTRLEQLFYALDKLKTLEGELENSHQKIKKQTNKIQSELTCILKNKESLLGELQTNKVNIDKLLLSSNKQNNEKHINNINKIHQNIYNRQSSINQLKIRKISSQTASNELEEKVRKTTEKTMEIEREINNNTEEKNTETRRYRNIIQEQTILLGITEIKGMVSRETSKLIMKTIVSSSKIKNQQKALSIICEHQNLIDNHIIGSFFKKTQKNKTINFFEKVQKILIENHSKIIDKIEEQCNEKLGQPRSFKVVKNLETAVIVGSIVSSIPLLIHGIYQEKNSKSGSLSTNAIAASVFISATIIASALKLIIKNLHQAFSAEELKKEINQQIPQIAKTIETNTEYFIRNSNYKNKIKKIDIPKKSKNFEFDLWASQTNSDMEQEKEKIEEKTKKITKNIKELEQKNASIKTEIQASKKTLQEKNRLFHETKNNITSLQSKIDTDEKLLDHLNKKEKNNVSEHIQAIEQAWSKAKKIKNQIDECDMNQETLQARLASLELNVQEYENQLHHQQDTVLTLMEQLDTKTLATHLLMPNMTEQAFHRLVQRHQGIEVNQLKQRVEKGRFKNSEGIVVSASAKHASSYFSFYHLLYSITDAVDFIEKSQDLVPNNNYTIQHSIQVGTTLSKETGTNTKKLHSKVCYTPYVDHATGHRRMVISHMF